jgi:hypothetical protein
MSTKSSLVYGKNYHLYEEIFDRENIWLQLAGAEFEASHQSITIGIPLNIWEIIRQHTFAKYDLVGLSDQELRTLAAQRVEGRLQQYKTSRGFLKQLMEAKGVKKSRLSQVRAFARRLRADRAWQKSLAKKTGHRGKLHSHERNQCHESKSE